MNRLNVFLLVLVIACALSVVNATYQQRHVFIALERLRNQERQLQQAWAQLQYQEGAWSRTARIERIAIHQLKMQPLTDERTQYLEVGLEVGNMPAAETINNPSGPK